MKIVGIHMEPGAVGWHRCWNWTSAMERLGHQVKHRPHAGTQFEWTEIDALLKGADVVVTGRMAHAQVFAALLAGRDRYGYKLVVDTDDNSDAVPAYNQAHPDYHAATNIARLVRAELREADLVTVSTDRLARWAAQYSKHSPVVVPNVVDPRLYAVTAREKESRHQDDVRIYWGGGGGHYADLLLLKEPLLRIMKERPKAKLIFSNFIPDWAVDLPPFRVFMIRFAEFWKYPQVLKWLCADVAVAPLVDNEFNRCKSHVKWLDYAMAGIPGVYQDIDPYATIVGHKASTPDEWYEAISEVLDSPETSRALTSIARHQIETRWSIDTWAPVYESMLKELLNDRPAPAFMPLTEGQPLEVTRCLTIQS